ncbi:hypothetical protein L2E82_16598 [Cichorium intybus]|uniref:Uncharacterized protein n=1 Tax=Cichorium intybus TaxID=13427 RepID=A0ACB9F623_CICIN|nr:hypothetical protein L2E82_16598 [Cichorium intybus]
MAYVRDFPSKLFFFCDEEPGKGGETPIVLSHVIYEKMKERHPEFVARLEEHGLTYTKVSSEEDDPSSITGSGWKSTYMTDDKHVAEERKEWSALILKNRGVSLKAISVFTNMSENM